MIAIDITLDRDYADRCDATNSGTLIDALRAAGLKKTLHHNGYGYITVIHRDYTPVATLHRRVGDHKSSTTRLTEIAMTGFTANRVIPDTDDAAYVAAVVDFILTAERDHAAAEAETARHRAVLNRVMDYYGNDLVAVLLDRDGVTARFAAEAETTTA